MIKIRGVSREMYFVLAAEARRMGIPFGGHASLETAIEASDSGASIIDHPTYQVTSGSGGICALCWPTAASLIGAAHGSIDSCQAVADRFRRNGTWWVPTLLVQEIDGGGTQADKIRTRIKEISKEFWAGSLLNGNWLHDSTRTNSYTPTDSSSIMYIIRRVGLPILAGTDMNVGPYKMWENPPGFVIHAELAIYVAEGLTPLEALQTATLNPAKLLHATDSLGTVAPGKLADLVLLDANPLADITNTTTIRAVVNNGRYFDRAALNELLTDVQAKAKQGFDYWWDGGKKRTGMTIGHSP
jgi:imidazolonepropionase-like amidohydrolase